MADRAMLRCSSCKQYTVQVVHERRNGREEEEEEEERGLEGDALLKKKKTKGERERERERERVTWRETERM